MNIQWKPVVNYWQGRSGYRPEAIVLHIAEGWLNGGYAWFNTPSSQVSAHYMIGKNGEVWQFVADENTAWHAGGASNPSWNLLKNNTNPNLYTIGIEHEGFTGEAWSDAMYESCAELIATLAKKFSIPIDRNHIIGHNEINSIDRSRCPGNGMDFNKLINLAINKLEDPKMIEELKSQIQTLNTQNTDLNTTITRLNTEKSNLNSRLASLEKQVEDLIKTKNADETIKSQNSILRNEVKKLQETNTKLNKDMDILQNKNKKIQEQIDSNSGNSGSFFDFLKSVFK